MKAVAIMPVRNEAWCLGLTARAILLWVDELIILDHASTDISRWIIDTITSEDRSADRITRIVSTSPVWTEMQHRQMLLEVARKRGATHIVMVDADEVLTGNLLNANPWGNGIDKIPAQRIMQIPWIQLKGDINHYMSSGMWAEQNISMAFRDSPEYHWQSSAGEEHFHHRHPKGRQCIPYRPLRGPFDGGLMHLQFLSERRLKAKQALYQMQERIRWPERQPADYARTVREAAAAQTVECPASWWKPYGHLMQYLDVNAEPWQEREVHRLIAEHGRAKFSDLDLFGVV